MWLLLAGTFRVCIHFVNKVTVVMVLVVVVVVVVALVAVVDRAGRARSWEQILSFSLLLSGLRLTLIP